MVHTVYDTATGRILWTSTGEPVAEDGMSIIDGEFDGRKHRVVDGAAVPIIPVQETPAQALAAWRAGASAPVREFAIRALKAGHINVNDARGWVTGRTTPPVITAALASIPAAQRDEAELRILGATEVQRGSQFVALMQAHLKLTDEQVDALFMEPAP